MRGVTVHNGVSGVFVCMRTYGGYRRIRWAFDVNCRNSASLFNADGLIKSTRRNVRLGIDSDRYGLKLQVSASLARMRPVLRTSQTGTGHPRHLMKFSRISACTPLQPLGLSAPSSHLPIHYTLPLATESAMHSPLSSPSLRAITHAHPHPHIARNSSYFAAHPPTPPARHPAQPPSHSYATLNHPSCQSRPRNGLPRTSPFPEVDYARHPADARVGTTRDTRPPLGQRRASFRESAIPILPTHVNAITRHEVSHADPTRRRPSFKIDLPPRPVPAEIIHSNGQCQNTPHPVAHRPGLAQITANNTALNAIIPPIIPGAPAFRDPFAGREYVILHPSTRGGPPGERGGYDPSPRSTDEYPSPTGETWDLTGAPVGLGYSLNRMRAPTPWIRGKEDDEWLNSQDMSEMEGRMRGLGVA